MSGAIPHHLFLLQGQSFNHTFAVINKLAVYSFLHRPHYTCRVQKNRMIINNYAWQLLILGLNEHYLHSAFEVAQPTFYDSIWDTSSRIFRQDAFQILINGDLLGFLREKHIERLTNAT